MGTAWQPKGLCLLFALVAVGCGSGDAGAPGPSPAFFDRTTTASTAEGLEAQSSSVGSAGGTASVPEATSPPDRPVDAVPSVGQPPDAGLPTSSAAELPAVLRSSQDATASAIARPLPADGTDASLATKGFRELHRATQSSPFHAFGGDVYAWDDHRRIVLLEIPVERPSLEEMRDVVGHRDGTIEDTAGTRAWVQQCARRYADDALDASDAVYGAVSAQAVHACLGGLTHLAELFARYWWTEAGVDCLSDAVTAHSLHGDTRPRPLAMCPSMGYDPTAPRPPGWLAQRCAEIAAVHPNARYPSGPAQPGEPLPSCWAPLLAIIESHAAESANMGLPDSPHDCYHAFLGYVWARQTDRESRPPSDLTIGCQYRAFEAIP